jgi:MerR family copper efflux transcriptional regulator
MKIGELARRTGVGIDTVRYYEREGLLRKAPRLASGYRSYGEGDMKRAELGRIRAGLATLLDACPGHGRLDDCPILNALAGEEA